MLKKIYVAGGCFWGVEQYFILNPKISQTSVGYLNSKIPNPTYQMVCQNITNAVEAVELVFDDKKISIEKIVKKLIKVIDPTSLNKQGNDIGSQYRSGFYSYELDDLKIIRKKLQKMQKFYKKPIVVEVALVKNYYLAEEYHQKYLQKNPFGYCHIRLPKTKKN